MTEKSDKKGKDEPAAPKEKVSKDAKNDALGQVRAENEKLRTDLEQAKQQSGEYLQLAQRLQADFDNYRKRTERENEDYRKYANQGLVADLLNVADDLDRALAAAKQEDALTVGVRAVRGNLFKILEQNGLKEIPADGKFDPNLHEAMIVADGDEDDRIAEVYQKGYTMNGRVLRTAKVKVTKKAVPAAAEAETAKAETVKTEEKQQ